MRLYLAARAEEARKRLIADAMNRKLAAASDASTAVGRAFRQPVHPAVLPGPQAKALGKAEAKAKAKAKANAQARAEAVQQRRLLQKLLKKKPRGPKDGNQRGACVP